MDAKSQAHSERLGDYRLIQRIGGGSQGEVWLAEDSVGRRVAVKSLITTSQSLTSNREEEALRLYQRLSDKRHLLQVLHVGRSSKGLYYSMELADMVETAGNLTAPMTLAHSLANGKAMDADAAKVIMLQLLDGVAALHEKGLLHRDIKPSNILRVNGIWKLADIGLLTEDRTEVSALGTVEFMPPNGRIDRTADLYACGRILYCLMTGLSARSFPTLPKSLLSANSSEVRALNAAVNRACELKNERRFQSVAEFKSALDVPATHRRPMKRLAALLFGCAIAVPVGWTLLQVGSTQASTNNAHWEPVFDGASIAGWGSPFPDQGTWRVEDGSIRCVRDGKYKLIGPGKNFGPGTLRVVASPDHEGARFGVRYACDQPGGGPMFMVMGDKYTWLRGYKDEFPPEQPGNWFSFPGPIPRQGEDVVLEVEWAPTRHQLRANGKVLYDLPPSKFSGPILLHVWAGDSATFRSVEFLPSDEK